MPALVSIPVELKDGRKWMACILGTPTTITATRISIPDILDDKINPEDFRRAIRLRDYLLDCIRLVYDVDAEYFHSGDSTFALWNFVKSDGPNFAVDVTQPLNSDYRINLEGLKHLIAAEPKMRPIVHLLAYGMNVRLPMQFRFLAHYKMIEMHYRITANKRFSDFISEFMLAFQQIYPEVTNVSQLCKRLSRLRNRCAHIKLNTGDLGFSHLEAENDELFKAMPVIGRVAARCVARNYPDSSLRFSATPEEGAEQFREMQSAGLNPIRVF